jgi:hypothetical protein
MKTAFSVGVSPLRNGGHPHWAFSSIGRSRASALSLHARLLDRVDVLPLIRRLGTSNGAVGKSELIWTSPLSVARAALFGDLNESERADFTHRRSDRMPIDAVFSEVVEGDGQFPVVVAAVVCEFDLNPRQYAVTS